MEYLRFKKSKHKGFYDPTSGRRLESIKGYRNRKGIDRFEAIHDPDKYPACVKEKRKETKAWVDKGDGFIILKMDITPQDVDSIIAEETSREARRLTAQETIDVEAYLASLKRR